MGWRDKLMRFMQGRYGVDALSKAMMVLAVVSMVLMMFTRIQVFNWITLALIFLVYFRMLSRNIPKRYQENQSYLRRTSRLRGWWARQKKERNIRRTHHIYRCPQCRQKLTVPRGKGRIEVTCPKCHTKFVKNS